VNSFGPFLSRLGTIHDPRRAEGKLYQLPYILLFSILAIVTGEPIAKLGWRGELLGSEG
jgi:hypothetical protein